MSREEGPLSDRKSQQAREQAEKLVTDLNREDLRALGRDGRFCRWFGKWSSLYVDADFRTPNGALLQEWNGMRSVLVQMRRELEAETPGFYERVLATRRALDVELKDIDKKLRPEQPRDEE
jgi:hypothetical protein